MTDKSLHKKKTVEGVQLESLGHGVWHVVGALKADIFMRHKPVQLGASGRRYTLTRWSAPPMDSEGREPTYRTLQKAVCAWKAWKEQCNGEAEIHKRPVVVRG